jgi:hypothetical protein
VSSTGWQRPNIVAINPSIRVTDHVKMHESQQENSTLKPRTVRAPASKAPRIRNGERILHFSLNVELHRALRVIVAERDTALQKRIVQALAGAAREAGMHGPTDGRAAG